MSRPESRVGVPAGCEQCLSEWEETLASGARSSSCQVHLESCASCRATVASLAKLRELRGDESPARLAADIEAGLQKFHASGSRVRYFAVAAALLLVVAAALSLRYAQFGTGSATMTLVAGGLRGPSALKPGDPLDAYDAPWTATEAGARLQVASVGTLHVTRGSQIWVREERTVGLQRGLIAADLSSLAGGEFVVRTPSQRVVVTGTRFAVQVHDATTRVDVLDGAVRVEDDEERIAVAVGQAWTRRQGMHAAPAERTRALQRVFDGAAWLEPDEEELEPSASREPEPSAPRGRDTKKADNDEPATADLLRRADACRRRADWKCVADRYREIIAADRGGSAAGFALVSLADVERQHLDKPRAAMRHYQAYLRAHPNGALVLEALDGGAKALQALGDGPAEAEILRQIIRDHPMSSPADRARRRLPQLSE